MKENRNLKEYTMKKRILYNPLTDEFATLGDKFEKIAHNKVNGFEAGSSVHDWPTGASNPRNNYFLKDKTT